MAPAMGTGIGERTRQQPHASVSSHSTRKERIALVPLLLHTWGDATVQPPCQCHEALEDDLRVVLKLKRNLGHPEQFLRG